MSSSKNQLEQYYQKQYALFVENLGQWGVFDHNEPYHKLRVSIKNIKAIHQMLSPVIADSYMANHLNRPFERVFRRAGKLRRWHLNQELALLYDLNPEIKKRYLHFTEKKIKQKKWLIRHTHIKPVLHRTKKAIHKLSAIFAHLPAEEMNTRVNQFVTYKITLIRQLFSEPLDEGVIHQIRFHIREIKAVLNVAPKQCYPVEFVTIIEESAEIIGKWHDRVDFSRSLQKFSRKHRKLQHFMQPLVLKLKKELSTLTTQINQNIDNLLAFYDRPDFLAQKKPVK